VTENAADDRRGRPDGGRPRPASAGRPSRLGPGEAIPEPSGRAHPVSDVVPSAAASRTVWVAGLAPRRVVALSRALGDRTETRQVALRPVAIERLRDDLRRATRPPDLLVLQGGRLAGIAREQAPGVPFLEVVDGDDLAGRLAAFRRGARAALSSEVDEETLAQEVWGLLGGVDMVRSTTLGTATVDELARALSEELQDSVAPTAGRSTPPTPGGLPASSRPPARSMLRLGPGRRIAEAVDAFVAEVRELAHSVPPPPPVPPEALAGREGRPLGAGASALPAPPAVPETAAASPGTVGVLPQGDAAVGDGSFLAGLRLFFVGADPGRGDLFARVARREGAEVVLSGPRGAGFPEASQLDPQAVVIDVVSVEDEQVEVVRRLQQDHRLRWAPLCPLRWADVTHPAAAEEASPERPCLDLDALATRLLPLLAGETELERRLRTGGRAPTEVRVETLGFPRLLRVLAGARDARPRELRLDEGVVQARVYVGGGRVRRARWSQTAPSMLELTGTRALAALMTLRLGRITVAEAEPPGDEPSAPDDELGPVAPALREAFRVVDEVTPLLPTSSYRSATHPAPEAPVIVRGRPLPLSADRGPRPYRPGAPAIHFRGEPVPTPGLRVADEEPGAIRPDAVTVQGDLSAPAEGDAPTTERWLPRGPDPGGAGPLEDTATEPRVPPLEERLAPPNAPGADPTPAIPAAGSLPPSPGADPRSPGEVAVPRWAVLAAFGANAVALALVLVLAGVVTAMVMFSRPARRGTPSGPEAAVAGAPTPSPRAAPASPPTGSDLAPAAPGAGEGGGQAEAAAKAGAEEVDDDDTAAATGPAAAPEAREAPADPTTLPADWSPPIPDEPTPRGRSDRMRRDAQALLAAGERAKAERTLEVAFEVHPYNPHVATDLVDLYLEAGRLPEAKRWVDTAVRIRPRRARYRLLRGDVLAAMGELGDARDEWRTAVRMERGLADAVAKREAALP